MIQYSYLSDSKQEIFSDDSAKIPVKELEQVLAWLKRKDSPFFRTIQQQDIDLNGFKDLASFKALYRVWRAQIWSCVKNDLSGQRSFLCAVSEDKLEIFGPEIDSKGVIIGPPPVVNIRVARELC